MSTVIASNATSDPCIRRNLTEVSFRWTVNKFSSRSEATGEKIVTESFSQHSSGDSIQWTLQIFPKGREVKFNDYVAVFLHLNSNTTNRTQAIHGSYALSVLDANNERRLTRQCSGEFVEGRGWGYANFFSRKELLDPKNGLLLCGQVTFHCDLFYSESDISKSHFEALTNLTALSVPRPVLPGDYLRKLFEGQTCTDITIKVEGQQISAHKNVLFFSPVFVAMFDHETQEKVTNTLEIMDFDFEVIKEMLSFIYSGEIVRKELVFELLKASDKYQLENLKLICQKEIAGHLSLENVVDTLIAADKFNAKELKDVVMHFMVENINLITPNADWKERLDNQLMAEIIVKLGQTLVPPKSDLPPVQKESSG